MENKELVKVFKNGNKHWRYSGTCDFCAGTGYIRAYSHIDNGVCYHCNGTGIEHWTVKELTSENQAKQKAKQAERARIWKEQEEECKAKQLAEEIDRCHKKALIENEWFDKHQKEVNESSYQGKVGEKISVKVVSFKCYDYEVQVSPWSSKSMTIYTMKDADGNTYVWNTGNVLMYMIPCEEKEATEVDRKGNFLKAHYIEEGEQFTITGKVKEHSEYKGVKQTVLTRCKISA